METYGVDAPAVTEAEAAELFYYHLKMAVAYFEVLPINHVFNTEKFHDLSLAAAVAFFEKLAEAYLEKDGYEDMR